MHAEEHYQFRHAIMRDAAYLLHPVTLRGTLHRVALEFYENEIGINLPELADKLRTQPLPVDSLMAQLATHARYAQDEPYANVQRLRKDEAKYLVRAGGFADRHYDHAQSLAAWLRLAEISDGITRFWALQRASPVCRTMSRLEEGLAVCEQALEIARRELDTPDIVLALAELGLAHWFNYQPDTAKTYLEEAVNLIGPDVPKSLEANTLGLLGMVYLQLERPEEAESLCLRALELLRQAGDRLNEGVLLQNLGGMMLDEDRLDEAEHYLSLAADLHAEINDETNLGVGLNNLTMLETRRGNYGQAIEYAAQAIPLLTRAGNRRSLGLTYSGRGATHRQAGDLERAKADFRKALAIHQEVGNFVTEGHCYCELGLIALAQGDPTEGRELWSHGVALVRSVRGRDGAQQELAEMRALCSEVGAEPFE